MRPSDLAQQMHERRKRVDASCHGSAQRDGQPMRTESMSTGSYITRGSGKIGSAGAVRRKSQNEGVVDAVRDLYAGSGRRTGDAPRARAAAGKRMSTSVCEAMPVLEEQDEDERGGKEDGARPSNLATTSSGTGSSPRNASCFL